MRLPAKKTLAIFTLCAFTAIASEGQQPIQLSKQASLAKEKIARLSVGDKISVVLAQAPEQYGTFKSSGQEDFTFYDVDQKNDATVRYAEVKKVKDGYGGYNSVTHRHTDPTKAYIGIGIAASIIVAVVVAAAAAKN